MVWCCTYSQLEINQKGENQFQTQDKENTEQIYVQQQGPLETLMVASINFCWNTMKLHLNWKYTTIMTIAYTEKATIKSSVMPYDSTNRNNLYYGNKQCYIVVVAK